MTRIEDLFEPLPGDDDSEPAPAAPTSLDEITERFGFGDVYAALIAMTNDEETKP